MPANTKPNTLARITNAKREPLSLSFRHSEVCASVGRCICDQYGRGGTVNLSAGESREIHPRLLHAEEFRNAERQRAIKVERPAGAPAREQVKPKQSEERVTDPQEPSEAETEAPVGEDKPTKKKARKRKR